MADTFDILFGEKISFVTIEGRVVPIGGPGSGGGTAGGGVTAANADALAQGMNDTELRDSLGQVKLAYGELAKERYEFQTVFGKLGRYEITPAQAVNWLSPYPAGVREGSTLDDIAKRLGEIKTTIDELTPIYRALNDEAVFRMRGGER